MAEEATVCKMPEFWSKSINLVKKANDVLQSEIKDGQDCCRDTANVKDLSKNLNI